METRICSKCKEEKSLEEYHWSNKKLNRRKYSCKDCESKRNKEYRENNKEKENLRNYRWYKDNKKKSKEREKRYRENNKERIKKRKRKIYNSLCLINSKLFIDIQSYEETRENGEYFEVRCSYCGKWFVPTNGNVSARLQSAYGYTRGERRLYCSESCKQLCTIYNQVTKYKFQEGESSREVQPQLRQLVFERDKYKCQKCNKEEDLQCHHIDPVKVNPIESADIDNCITLCIDCHKKVHKISGCGYGELASCL